MMGSILEKKIIDINGKSYLTVQDFADVTNRSIAAIRQYMALGNRIRKLKFTHFAGKPFIPIEEVFEFPFTMSGRNKSDVYNYQYNDKTKTLQIIKARGFCNSSHICKDHKCDGCSYYTEFKE